MVDYQGTKIYYFRAVFLELENICAFKHFNYGVQIIEIKQFFIYLYVQVYKTHAYVSYKSLFKPTPNILLIN